MLVELGVYVCVCVCLRAEYYTDVSAAIPDDNYFQLLMWNLWPLKVCVCVCLGVCMCTVGFLALL